LALALCHEDEPVEALSANAMLGGDSAARGLMLGLLMGARHGADAFSAGWTDQLKAIGTINHALERLES
jgi:ADP-ribosylglycohydrolase